MLRRTFFVMTLLVFASGVLLTSVWRTSAQTLRENDGATASPLINNGMAVAASESADKRVEYDLTWPGILPDHFLYPVKMIRDRIWLWLTTDSLKKAELLLRFADKRVWSAQILLDKGQPDLAASTATKAEKYLQRAIDQEKKAREKGKETTAFLEKLSLAGLKHEEMLLDMKKRVEGEAEGGPLMRR